MTGTASRPKAVRNPKVEVRKPANVVNAKRSTKAVGFRGVRSGSVTKTAEKVSFASLRISIDLTQAEFAKLFPISIRSLAGIESGTAPSESATRRFQELNRLIAALGEIMRTASIGTWLLTPICKIGLIDSKSVEFRPTGVPNLNFWTPTVGRQEDFTTGK